MSSPLDLLGRWYLERTIEDRRGATTLGVAGTAVLAPTDDGAVRWHEEGVLHRPGAEPVEVSRTLLLVPPAPGGEGSWWVRFADGRPFHPWRPGADVQHPCAPDHYRGRVDLDGADAWRVRWTVLGPAKDYTMRTSYARALASPP